MDLESELGGGKGWPSDVTNFIFHHLQVSQFNLPNSV